MIEFNIKDQNSDYSGNSDAIGSNISGKVFIEDAKIDIHIDNYQRPDGKPVLTVYNNGGRPQLHVYADINNSYPTDVIIFDDAHVSMQDNEPDSEYESDGEGYAEYQCDRTDSHIQDFKAFRELTRPKRFYPMLKWGFFPCVGIRVSSMRTAAFLNGCIVFCLGAGFASLIGFLL